MGVPCPECGKGEIVEKNTKWGKPFYSCDRYPKCKFSLKHKPVPQSCPKCGTAYLVEKTTKTGTTLECAKEGCDYTHAAA